MMIYEKMMAKSVLHRKVAVFATMFILFTILFYRQSIAYGGMYGSDLPSHIRFGVDGTGYSLLYIMIGYLVRLSNSTLPVALMESGLVVCTGLVADWFLAKHFSLKPGWRLLISAGSLFLCSVYVPGISEFYYRNSVITQPWHNITYFPMRLFAIPTISFTLDVIEQYREKISWKDWLKIAIPLTISTSVKPNFLVAYSFTLLILLIVDFVKVLAAHRLSLPMLWRFIAMGSVVFPSLFILWQQSQILYAAKTDPALSSGIALALFSSKFFSYGAFPTIIKLLQAFTFPSLALCAGKKKTRADKTVCLLFLVTLLQVILLTETGPRAAHGNFYWGMYGSAYILFLYAAGLFVQRLQRSGWTEKTLGQKCIMILGTSLLVLHYLSGMAYFCMLLAGSDYIR